MHSSNKNRRNGVKLRKMRRSTAVIASLVALGAGIALWADLAHLDTPAEHPTSTASVPLASTGDLPDEHHLGFCGTGDQALVDRCPDDQVAIYEPYLAQGETVFTLHYEHGGHRVPKHEGARIWIDGIEYESAGVVAALSASQHTAADLPTGADAYLQTCDPDPEHMVFLALMRV